MPLQDNLIQRPVDTGPATGEHRVTHLANGLRIVVRRVPGMTGCAVAVHYRAGFRTEPRGRAGFAHLFEHMMFQGSAGVPLGRHFAEIQGAGGSVNGNTFTDVADYHQTAPVGSLGRILELEADRMGWLQLTQRNLDVQRDVVREEINLQVAGRAYGGFPWTVLPAAMHAAWELSHNGFGTSDDLGGATLDACEEFYAGHYAPANAVVGVCSDRPVEEVAAVAAATFDRVPFRSPARPTLPLTDGDRPAEIDHHDAFAPRPALSWGWSIPAIGDAPDDYAAYAVLSRLLTGGAHGILRQAVRPLGASIDTSVGLFGPLMAAGPDTLALVAHHDDGTAAQVQDRVQAALEQLARDLDSETTRSAVLGTVGELYRRLDAPAHRTRTMTRGELLFGMPDLAERYEESLWKVDAPAVQRAAATLADPARRGVVRLRTEAVAS